MQTKAEPADRARESELAWEGKSSRLLCRRVRGASFLLALTLLLDSLLFVQIYGGYFIHYFAPRGLPPVEKNVVFVIDVSGSMFGTKLQQVTRTFPVASEICVCLSF